MPTNFRSKKRLMMVPFNTTVLSMPCDVSDEPVSFSVLVYVVCTRSRRDGEHWIMCFNGTRKQHKTVLYAPTYIRLLFLSFFRDFYAALCKKGKRRSLSHMHYHSYVKNDEIEKRRPLKNKKLYVEQLIRIFNFKMQLNFPSPHTLSEYCLLQAWWCNKIWGALIVKCDTSKGK